jgi:hypothetical protein
MKILGRRGSSPGKKVEGSADGNHDGVRFAVRNAWHEIVLLWSPESDPHNLRTYPRDSAAQPIELLVGKLVGEWWRFNPSDVQIGRKVE